ncbi:aminoglycoside N(6')-acetyltransferase [Paenibacillus sp. J31TS4]|uniref:GNAT family N-acetyltransferase n=1 Tax=Paenibacillus sp. J31TS4 TaxID=2807195 RepID=UPI001B0CF6E3|nr:GNAT family protein [Paenibacillus sp. J31TS4]GIP38857.1 aminoglycoside N(6')-acetyltransferase [Paenibacillus sp. J31TS4]
MSAAYLKGTNIYLRPPAASDAEAYHRLINDPEARRLTGSHKLYSTSQLADYLSAKAGDASSVLLLIASRETGAVVGDVALQQIDRFNRSASIRVAVHAEERGKGYGTEAMKLMLEYGFGIANLHRIELNVYTFNEQAIRLYEKLGFHREGVQRDYLYYDHAYHDSILMSLLEDEYRALHRSRL